MSWRRQRICSNSGTVETMAALDPVADLERRLVAGASKTWRGMRGAIRAWWRDHELADHPATVGMRIALALIEKKRALYKHAGTFVLVLLGDQLRCADLAVFAQLFEAGHLGGETAIEREVVDRFADLLALMLAREARRMEVARGLAEWRHASTIWQRRAACLAFAAHAPHADAVMARTILAVCGTVVWSHRPHDQSAVATALRELSLAEPARVETFFRRHARFMSRSCARTCVAKFSVSRRRELLAHHERATTI
jgi:DNA alkylation repair enzyme